MGAKQKRCPRCKKLRRFVEGGEDYERRQRSQRWSKVNGRWVCFVCIPVIPVRQNDDAACEITPAPQKIHQCKTCPWKVTTDPTAEIPNYVPELARALTCTIAKSPMESLFPVIGAGGPMRMMACHYSRPGEEFPCAGWLEHQLGVGNNIAVRLLVVQGRLPVPVTEGEQHERYEDTLPCGAEEE